MHVRWGQLSSTCVGGGRESACPAGGRACHKVPRGILQLQGRRLQSLLHRCSVQAVRCVLPTCASDHHACEGDVRLGDARRRQFVYRLCSESRSALLRTDPDVDVSKVGQPSPHHAAQQATGWWHKLGCALGPLLDALQPQSQTHLKEEGLVGVGSGCEVLKISSGGHIPAVLLLYCGLLLAPRTHYRLTTVCDARNRDATGFLQPIDQQHAFI